MIENCLFWKIINDPEFNSQDKLSLTASVDLKFKTALNLNLIKPNFQKLIYARYLSFILIYEDIV